MKINLTEENEKDTLLSHMVLSCMSKTVVEHLVSTRAKEGIICDIKLTVDGYELNIQSFVTHWEKQVTRMIGEKAKEIVEERFREVNDLLYDLEERVKPEIEKRVEDWEREVEVD